MTIHWKTDHSEYSGTWLSGFMIWQSCNGGTAGGQISLDWDENLHGVAAEYSIVQNFNGKSYCMKVEIIDDTIRTDFYNASLERIRCEVARFNYQDCSSPWRNTETDVWYGANIFLPNDFEVVEGPDYPSGDVLRRTQKISQFHEGDNWAGGLQCMNSDRIQFRMHADYTYPPLASGDEILWEGTTSDYQGRWVPYIVHINHNEANPGLNGSLEVWFDGVKIVDYVDNIDMRLTRTSIASGYTARYPTYGIYGGKGTGNNSIYFTDNIIASTQAEVEDYVLTPRGGGIVSDSIQDLGVGASSGIGLSVDITSFPSTGDNREAWMMVTDDKITTINPSSVATDWYAVGIATGTNGAGATGDFIVKRRVGSGSITTQYNGGEGNLSTGTLGIRVLGTTIYFDWNGVNQYSETFGLNSSDDKYVIIYKKSDDENQTTYFDNFSRGTGRPTTSGADFIDPYGKEIIYVGACKTHMYRIIGNAPGTSKHTRLEDIADVSTAGGNLIILCLNLGLYTHGGIDGASAVATYKSHIATWVNTFKTNNQYYMFRLHNVASIGGVGASWAGPGGTWQITTSDGDHGDPSEYYPYYRNAARDMFVDLVSTYKDDPNFMGVCLLNEPASGTLASRWNYVYDYYEYVIPYIRAEDPDCTVIVMPPNRYGNKIRDFINPSHQGYLSDSFSNIAYEFHMYYYNYYYSRETDTYDWGVYYFNGNQSAGDTRLTNWINHYAKVTDDPHGAPIICGEYGITGTDDHYCATPPATCTPNLSAGCDCFDKGYGGPIPNYQMANERQMAIQYSNGINMTQWQLYALSVSNESMRDYDGYGWSERGQIWADAVPAGLTKAP